MAACLTFDSSYATEGWLCVESIMTHRPKFPVYVLCLDRTVYDQSLQMRGRYRTIQGIELYELEKAFPVLAHARKDRPWDAYTQTCKVHFPVYVLSRFNTGKVFYVDSDMYFWNDPGIIETVMGDASVMVKDRETDDPPPAGYYNDGFFAVKDDTAGITFLKWWQDQVIEWCLWETGPDGRFLAEGYLNILHDEPDKFEGVLVCPTPGINMGPWTLHKHIIELVKGKPVIDGRHPLVCFHYRGVEIGAREAMPSTFSSLGAAYLHESYFRRYLQFERRLSCGLIGYRERR